MKPIRCAGEENLGSGGGSDTWILQSRDWGWNSTGSESASLNKEWWWRSQYSFQSAITRKYLQQASFKRGQNLYCRSLNRSCMRQALLGQWWSPLGITLQHLLNERRCKKYDTWIVILTSSCGEVFKVQIGAKASPHWDSPITSQSSN